MKVYLIRLFFLPHLHALNPYFSITWWPSLYHICQKLNSRKELYNQFWKTISSEKHLANKEIFQSLSNCNWIEDWIVNFTPSRHLSQSDYASLGGVCFILLTSLYWILDTIYIYSETTHQTHTNATFKTTVVYGFSSVYICICSLLASHISKQCYLAFFLSHDLST